MLARLYTEFIEKYYLPVVAPWLWLVLLPAELELSPVVFPPERSAPFAFIYCPFGLPDLYVFGSRVPPLAAGFRGGVVLAPLPVFAFIFGFEEVLSPPVCGAVFIGAAPVVWFMAVSCTLLVLVELLTESLLFCCSVLE